MFTKMPVSMLLIIWMAGIILFFNMFLGPFTNQLQTINNVNSQLNNSSLQNPKESIAIGENENIELLDYTPLAIFDKLLQSNSK